MKAVFMGTPEFAVPTLQAMIDESERVVFFGGAGVSTESGIPDFRSKDGLYNKPDVNFAVKSVASSTLARLNKEKSLTKR